MGYKEVLMPEPLDDGKKREKKEILNTRISPVNFEKINDVADLVESFQSASIQARNLGQCADRKSTRLNSSPKPTSYAVFCL